MIFLSTLYVLHAALHCQITAVVLDSMAPAAGRRCVDGLGRKRLLVERLP
jgi:hypothetical protein